ncbi:MAG: hypothetical protein QNJ57_01080 [Flavobacteriaceae bacterium]|nr:hypothetical protein [Flavobacteriaceae bacterium]
MQLLKRVFDFYVFSNMHVALATFCLTKITLLLFGVSDPTVPSFVFFATVLSYNFVRLYRKSEITSWFYNWIAANQTALVVVTIISFVFLVYLAVHLQTITLLALVPFGIVTVFYVVPLRGKMALRTVPGFKLFLIAFCWASVTVLIPVINHKLSFSKDVYVMFLQRLLFVAAITIPFDIRDVDYDTEALKTLPQVFGIANAKRIGIVLLMLFLGLNFLKEEPGANLRVEFVVTLISLLLLVRASNRQNNYYSAFFVEAIPIVWFLLLVIF